jgi:predicted ATP-binding protein involved in virulence
LETDRFFVKTLTLENFRCFEKVELGPFDPHFNLLIGANGAGKSSVLLALAQLFRDLGSRGSCIRSDEILSERDNRTDGTNHSYFWRLSACLVAGSTEVWTASEYRNGDQPDYFPKIDHSHDLIVFYDVRRQFSRGYWQYEYEPEPFGGPGGPAFEGWLDAGVDATSLREWFKDQTLVALQSEQRARNASADLAATRTNRQLTLVQTAVLEAVEGATNVEYDAELRDIIVYFKYAPTQRFAAMSDGQRGLIGLVADIARRACLLNAETFGAQALKETSGLVLIDELDLHLHPKWQRRVIVDLKRIFPKIQFFATTHSPQVIGEARPEEIVLLTPQGQKPRPSQTFGMDSNWVLECVMEAEGRDPQIAKRIKDVFDAIDDDRLEEARAMIAALRAEIGEAPDVIGAESYIWRIEHEGDEAAE